MKKDETAGLSGNAGAGKPRKVTKKRDFVKGGGSGRPGKRLPGAARKRRRAPEFCRPLPF